MLMTVAPAYSMTLSCAPIRETSSLLVTISGGMTNPKAQPIYSYTPAPCHSYIFIHALSQLLLNHTILPCSSSVSMSSPFLSVPLLYHSIGRVIKSVVVCVCVCVCVCACVCICGHAYSHIFHQSSHNLVWQEPIDIRFGTLSS